MSSFMSGKFVYNYVFKYMFYPIANNIIIVIVRGRF